MNKNIFYCDFETTTAESAYFKKHNDTTVYLANIRESENNNYITNCKHKYKKCILQQWKDHNITLNSMESFLDAIIELSKHSKNETIFYFHNLSFDGDFIIKYLFKDENWKRKFKFFNKQFNKDQEHWSFFKNGAKIYKIDLQLWRNLSTTGGVVKIKHNVSFRCTYLLMLTSVGNLSLNYGNLKNSVFEKGKELKYWNTNNEMYGVFGPDMNQDIRNLATEYIENDTLVVQQAHSDFQDILQNKNDELNYHWNPKAVKAKNGWVKAGISNFNVGDCITMSSLARTKQENYVRMICYLMKNKDKLQEQNSQGFNELELYQKYESYFYQDSDIYKYYKINSLDHLEFAKLSYSGGISQYNKKYQNEILDEEIVETDIASSYPFQMTKLMPYDRPYTLQEINWEEKKNKIKYHRLKYYILRVNGNINEKWQDIPLWRKAKRVTDSTKSVVISLGEISQDGIFNEEATPDELSAFISDAVTKYLNGEQLPQHSFDWTKKHKQRFNKELSDKDIYVLYEEEFKLLEQMYDLEYTEAQEVYFKADYIFKGFIDKYYYLKEDASKKAKASDNENDKKFWTSQKNMFKVLLNSSYGANGMREEYSTLIITDNIELKRGDSIVNNDNDKSLTIETVKTETYGINKEIKQYDAFYDIKKDRNLPNKMLAAHITSLARIQLINQIMLVGPERFIYGDTDSTYFKFDWKNEDINEFMEISSNLGGWELEEKINKMLVCGSKFYLFEDQNGKLKSTIAGIDKGVSKHLTFEKLRDELKTKGAITFESGKKQKVKTDDGIILQEKLVEKKLGEQ